MRIMFQLDRVESMARSLWLDAHPDANSAFDEAVYEMAEALEAGCDGGPVALEAVDLLDADGVYLYTLVGEPR